ncbi:hypothetical protein KRR55_15670 [Paeniglutamicibacter sp. ABSL32-1]|uniref:hypothetical protein n=1 Tax=Paeniglutamicibacter quisquiliarum TaxID=2849498 RepID=UPI001C2D23AB|nr:hypothetical protein [Paeniglutamicibacter quisquiliarum]MBV1780554.1 hypothetical protein [Paeniglutamicibacter quisquiliarum]
MNQPVDFATPQLYLAAAVILAVFAVPLAIHAYFRRRKFRRDTENLRTFARRRDIGVESGVAAAGIIAALVCAGVFGLGWKQSANNLVANVENRYAVTDVVMTSWNGSWATVDLKDGKGLAATGIEVSFDAVGTPVLRDPAFALDPRHAVDHSLELR